MPIYDYVADTEGCAHCREPFEMLQKLSEADLTTCPECGTPVHRKISAPSLAIGGAHLIKQGNAEKKGFTQYRKTAKGVYEKAYGKGPRYISGK